MKRPEYFNKAESKKFLNKAEAVSWANNRKEAYKQLGTSVKITIDRGNDQLWEAKILPKTS